MAATFSWHIETCERDISTGGITMVHWRCNAEETVGSGEDAVTHTATSYGAQPLTPDPSSSDFIVYANVSEANAKAWIWSADVDQTDIQDNLQAQIDLLKSPVTAMGNPWDA